jgi:hypothetical protein
MLLNWCKIVRKIIWTNKNPKGVNVGRARTQKTTKNSDLIVFGKFKMQKTRKSVGKKWNFFWIRYQRKIVRKMFYLKYRHHDILHDLGRLNASKVQNLKYSIFEHQNNIFPVVFFLLFCLLTVIQLIKNTSENLLRQTCRTYFFSK